MKVLLAAVNAKYIHSNLAVYSLRAYARQYQGEIGIAEYTINQTVDEILMDIYSRQPDILCLSCYLWNISYVGQIVTEAPKILPHTEIWLGGPEAQDPEKISGRGRRYVRGGRGHLPGTGRVLAVGRL